jgi:hypothetical protein
MTRNNIILISDCKQTNLLLEEQKLMV